MTAAAARMLGFPHFFLRPCVAVFIDFPDADESAVIDVCAERFDAYDFGDQLAFAPLVGDHVCDCREAPLRLDFVHDEVALVVEHLVCDDFALAVLIEVGDDDAELIPGIVLREYWQRALEFIEGVALDDALCRDDFRNRIRIDIGNGGMDIDPIAVACGSEAVFIDGEEGFFDPLVIVAVFDEVEHREAGGIAARCGGGSCGNDFDFAVFIDIGESHAVVAVPLTCS